MAAEFWITYHFTSRFHLPPTTQLVELENPEHKLTDLEDVLEHVFRQGIIDVKYRSATWWEKKDGVRVKASTIIADLLAEKVGTCPDTALKLVIEDAPTALWFSYIYIHSPPDKVVTQRIKFDSLEKRFERLAHVTNFIFAQGFLPSRYRAVVRWETPCGRRISEFAIVDEILVADEGISEERPLRLVIDDLFPHEHGCEPPAHHHHHEHWCGDRVPLEPHHHKHFEHHQRKFPHESCGCEREPIRERYDHRHHHYASCPTSPTVVASPLKTVSRFH